jgi:hypothetical protein
MFRKRGFLSVSLCNILIVSVILWSFPLPLEEINAQEVSPVYAGQGMATGEAFIVLGPGQRMRMGPYPMPVFEGSRIQTGEGAVVISLVPDGLIEVHKGTEILLNKREDKNVLEITRGVVRFSIPSQDALSIITPSAKVSVRGPSRLAGIDTAALPPGGGEMVGVVGVEEDGVSFISSTKDSLEVSTGDGKVHVLGPGEVIRLALAEESSEGERGGVIRKGLTSLQKNVLAALLLTGLFAVAIGVGVSQSGGGDGGGGGVASPSQ